MGKRPMGEPATSLQQGLHTRPTGEPRPDGATIRMCTAPPPQGVTTRACCRSNDARTSLQGGLMRGG
eukprot:2686231-Prymnesium_polylepis.1